MNEYVGKYRVVCEFDMRNLKPIKHDTWIPCKGGGQIYREDKGVLVYWSPKRKKSLHSKMKSFMLDDWMGSDKEDAESCIKFPEQYLDQVAKMVGAMTKGKDIPPHYKVNAKLMPLYDDFYGENGKYRHRVQNL